MTRGLALAAALLLAALAGGPVEAAAQVGAPREEARTPQETPGDGSRLDSLDLAAPGRPGAPAPLGLSPGRRIMAPDPVFLLDAPVDRTEYRVGPGDLLALSIQGALDLLYELPVTPEATVVVPTLGVIDVDGLTLEEAERRMRARALRFYRNVEVALTLAEVRAFKVHVVGDVRAPGLRVASSVTRVSELLPPDSIPRRNVILRRAQGDSIAVDLAAFRQSGDLGANPVVREGDTILVPAADETVEVYGRVFFPGTYEHRPGESLAALLRVANGSRGFPSDAHDVVRVTRFEGPAARRFFEFSRSEATGARGASFVLEPFDAVYVPSLANYKIQRTATVEGEVVHPGTYPIRPDTTTVRDLVEMAGGFTTKASLVAARLRRRAGMVEAGEANGQAPLEAIPPELLTEDERRILRVRQSADAGNVVVDFEELFREGRQVYDIPLRDGDLLVVPERREGVTVLGAVHMPGIVTFAPEREIEDYADLAGGFTDRADRNSVVVLKARSQTQLERHEVRSLEPGDTIIVPFEKERDWLRTWQTTFSIVTGITSLVLSFIAATR